MSCLFSIVCLTFDYLESEKGLPQKSEVLTQGEAFKQAQHIIKTYELSFTRKMLSLIFYPLG